MIELDIGSRYLGRILEALLLRGGLGVFSEESLTSCYPLSQVSRLRHNERGTLPVRVLEFLNGVTELVDRRVQSVLAWGIVAVALWVSRRVVSLRHFNAH
jgi:hypothetical protein